MSDSQHKKCEWV